MTRCITVLSLFLFGLLVLAPVNDAQAQRLKKLRDRAEQAARGNNNASDRDQVNQPARSTEGRSITSPSERAAQERANELGMTDDQAAALLAFYKPLGKAADRFPYEVTGDNLQGTSSTKSCDANLYVDVMEQLDWPNLSQRLAADQAQYPAVFSYRGIEEPGRYGEMPYGGNGRAPWEGVSDNARQLNSSLKLIYQWQGKITGKERELAQNIQQYLNLTDNAQDLEKVDCALMAVRFVNAVRSVQPDNPLLDDLESEANSALDKQLTNISHLITGPFHKSHLRQTVALRPGVALGTETAADVVSTITVPENATLVGYFQSSNKAGGGVPTLTWFEVTEEYHERMANGFAEPSPQQYLPMFTGQQVKDDLEAQGHMAFELFPDPASLNYESHLQYIPHLNFAKYLTQQLPGTYAYKFRWGRNNPMATGVVTFDITTEGRNALKAYYDELMAKKIDTVTFPLESCTDRRSSITNLSHMDKYGTLLRIDYERTGDIMFPWPRDHEVQWNTAAGWAAFEKEDGRVEVMPIEFRKDPSASRWDFHSVGFTPSDYGMTGTVSINPELLQFGYEMRKENVNTCQAW